jgi:DNA (cytosine-5)-methyltransferase 1
VKQASHKTLRAIDFFCGAGGMSYGLARAGIEVVAGIDCDESCRETYEKNNKPTKFLPHDVTQLLPGQLAQELSLCKNDDNLVFVGCTPCQFWSKINTDRRKSKKSAFLLREFERFIDWFRPGFIIIENVPGLLSKKRHSILPQFEKFLRDRDYAYAHGIINANLYGVPQNRRRYLLVATRLAKDIKLPRPYTNKNLVVRKFIGVPNGFRCIRAGTKDTTTFLHSAAKLSLQNLQRLAKTPPNGGTRSSWKDDPKLQIHAYEGKDSFFRDVYGRMYWNRPAPTITTRFNSVSNGRFGHPSQRRGISLREGATLQTFPKRYVFQATNEHTLTRQIGNAVPPALALRIGKHLKRIHSSVVNNGH